MRGVRSTTRVYTHVNNNEYVDTCVPRETCRGSVECHRDTSARGNFFVGSAVPVYDVFAAEGNGNFATAPRTKRRLGEKPFQARATGWKKEHRGSTLLGMYTPADCTNLVFTRHWIYDISWTAEKWPTRRSATASAVHDRSTRARTRMHSFLSGTPSVTACRIVGPPARVPGSWL